MTVLDWLMDSDPSLRWQVLQDLSNAAPEAVTAEGARVATEGWGARLLALRDEGGCVGYVLLGQNLVKVDHRLFGRSGEAALNTRLHPGHEDRVPEFFPAFFRFVDCHDRPATLGCPAGVEDLTLGQEPRARMDGCKRRLLLFLGASREEVHDSVGRGGHNNS